MPDMRAYWRFAAGFVLGFAVLAVPWPGFRVAVRVWFESEAGIVGRIIFPGRALSVGDNHDSVHPSVDTKISILKPVEALDGAESSARELVLNSRSFGWMPQAMTLALVLATPVEWHKRWRLLGVNLLAVHLFVIATIVAGLGSAIFPSSDNMAGLVFGWADLILVENLWVTFLGPTLIWMTSIVLMARFELAKVASVSTGVGADRVRPA